jgi:hypothetical protein
MFWTGFVVGIFVGCLLGVFVMGLMIVSRDAY